VPEIAKNAGMAKEVDGANNPRKQEQNRGNPKSNLDSRPFKVEIDAATHEATPPEYLDRENPISSQVPFGPCCEDAVR